MEPKQLTVVRSNADCIIGAAEGVAVAVWVQHTLVEDVAALGDAARRAVRGPRQPVKLVQIVSATAITPDGAARAALARMLRGLQGTVSHSAIVHEAEGFRAAMVRSIVTGIAALSNPGFPHRVFARLLEATAWMCDDGAALGPRTFEAQHIEAVVERLRSGPRSARGKGVSARAGIGLER